MADEDEYYEEYEEEYYEEYEEEYSVLPIDEEWVPNPKLQFLKMRGRWKTVAIENFKEWIEEELEEEPEDSVKDGYRRELQVVYSQIKKGGMDMNYAQFLNGLRMVQNVYENEDIFRGLDEDDSDENSDWLIRSGETPMSGDWEEDDEEEVEEEEDVQTTAGDVGAAKRSRDEDVGYVAEKRPREMSLREAVRVLRRHTINTGVKFQELLDKIDKTEG